MLLYLMLRYLLFHYFDIALLTLCYIKVLLFDAGFPNIASFNIALFNVHYLMLHIFMLLCLMLHYFLCHY